MSTHNQEMAFKMFLTTQALKFESYHTSALARIMLERAVTNVRIAHRIYW